MKKALRIGLIVVCVMAASFFILAGLTVLFEDKIKSVVVAEMNKSLKTAVAVGEIDFSVIRHFPYASLQFKNIEARGNIVQNNKRPLLKAEKFDLLFNLFSVFYESYELKKIVVENASLNIITDKTGQENFDVFKKQEKGSKDINASFEKCDLKNVNVLIQDEKNNLVIDASIDKATLAGHFAEDKFTLSAKGELLSKELSYDDIHYLKNKQTSVAATLEIDTRNKYYSFNQSRIKIASLDLFLSGFVENKNDTRVDIKVSSKQAKANELLSTLPASWIAPKMLEYKYSGNVFFEALVKGIAAVKNPPLIEVRFGTQGTDIIPDKESYALKRVSLNGFYTNKKSVKNPVSFLSLKDIKATLEGRPVKASIELENLKNPWVNIAIDADAGLAGLSRYFPTEFTEQQKGSISFHGTIKGKADKKETYRSSGKMTFTGIGFKVKDRPLMFRDVSGVLNLDNNQVNIQDIKGIAGQTDFVLNAQLVNFYGYLFTQGQELSIKGDVRSQMINMSEFMQTDGKKSDSAGRVDFPADINLNLDVQAAGATYHLFKVTELRGNISLANKTLSTNSLSFNAVDGRFNLQGSINSNQKDSLLISYHASLSNINIQKLFAEMGNFGQQTLTDKNLRGKVTADIDFASVWSKTMNVNTNRIFASSSITIDNGELNNFDPMLKLSRFVKGTDLKNIRFSTLKNQIEIRNRKIYIPSMDIKSSALNMSIKGTHDFDNVVDYSIQMKMNQLLGNKVRNLNTEFGVIEDDGSTGLTLLLTMKGPVDNPRFAYDRKGVETKIKTSVKEGKNDFLKILKEEFKGQNSQEKTKEEPRKQNELELETEEGN